MNKREAHWVHDDKGGYWQIPVGGEPYNFRTPPGFVMHPKGEAVTDAEILWDMRHIDDHLKYSEDAASMLIQGVRRVLRRVMRPAEAQVGGDMTECGHSKHDPCHNCEPLDAPVGVEGLLPCPFCGAPAERIDFGPGDAENEGGSCIACTRCQASGPVEFGRKDNFITNWNERAQQPPAEAVGTVLGGEFHYLRVNHGLPDGTMLYAAPPSVSVGVEAIVEAIISDPANETDTDTLRRCVASALDQQPAAVDEALHQAARSLRTIADQAGKVDGMEGMQAVRGYANSRATVAEAALAAQPAAVDGADVRDARRYRYLRDNNGFRDHHGVKVFIAGEAHGPGHLDEQVDAALAGQQGGRSDDMD